MNSGFATRAGSIIRGFGSVLALVVLVVILAIATPKFATVNNIINVLAQTAVNGFLSIAMLLTLITAGIDLSVGTNAILCACLMGMLMTSFDINNPILLLLAALACGCVVGLVNGLLLTKLKLPHPFVSTLGMKYFLAGLALLIVSTKTISGFPHTVTWLGSFDFFSGRGFNGIPASFVLLILALVLMHILLTRSALGRSIFAVGGNPEATRLAGINTDRVLVIVYALAGFFSAIAGITIVGRSGVANPSAGMTGNYETDAIAACIIGGASFMGGKGTASGTLIGALIIAVVRNGLTLLNAQSDVQFMVIGGVIIVAVVIDVQRTRLDERRRRLAAV